MPKETSDAISRTAGRVLNDPASSPEARSLAGSALSQSGKGITEPFTKKEAEATEGVDNETRLFHGIDPETKERVSVTLEGLQAEFGEKEGERKYMEVAGIAGGSVFFNPHTEATSFRPPLGIAGLTIPLEELQERLGPEKGKEKFESNQKHAAKVAEILASTEE